MTGAEQLTADIKSADEIDKAVAEAMAAAYRQGWDDCVSARTRPWWWRPVPAVTPRGRELLIEDWVPAEVGTYAKRIMNAIEGVLARRKGG